jgi:hypothetical protein
MIKLPDNKQHLRDAVDLLVLDFLARGGRITVCRPSRRAR